MHKLKSILYIAGPPLRFFMILSCERRERVPFLLVKGCCRVQEDVSILVLVALESLPRGVEPGRVTFFLNAIQLEDQFQRKGRNELYR